MNTRPDKRKYRKMAVEFNESGFIDNMNKIVEDVVKDRFSTSFINDNTLMIMTAPVPTFVTGLGINDQLVQVSKSSSYEITNNDTNLEAPEGIDFDIAHNDSNYNVNDIKSEDNDFDDAYDCNANMYSDLNFNTSQNHVYERPAEYQSFDIINYAKNDYEKKLSTQKNDNNIVLSDDCPYKMNEVVEKFQYYIASENLYDKTVVNLFGLLSNVLPKINWPISIVNNNIVLKLDEYSIEDYRTLHFDICPSFCMTYVGDYSELFKCPKCGGNRYRPCHRCHNAAECKHRFARVPIRRIWYRPLIVLVNYLLETEYFLTAINYNCDSDSKYYRSDIRTGSNYKKHNAEMHQKFENKNDSSLIMVNLLISEFYDGIQLFKTKVQNFWPLMISILNLPLSMRIQSGIGTFLMSLYTGKLNTPTERFVLEECFVEELKQFYEGVLVEKNGKKYFVQIRLISTILDTKGFEETMHVQGTGSYAGCFLCNIGRGFKLGENSKHVPILGHRVALELEHVMRSVGQSENCCPKGYYDINVNKSNSINLKNKDSDSELDIDEDNEYDSDENDNHLICKDVGIFNFNKLKTIDDYKTKLQCLNLTNNQFNDLKNYMQGKSKNNEWVWYHGYSNRRFNYDNFVEYLWFPHCDYRDQKSYQRKTTDQYYNDNQQFLEIRKKKKSVKHYNGVKGVWHLNRLPYAKIETDICWDPFHTIFNVAKNIIKNWKDERSDQYNIPYLKKNKLHHYLYDKDKAKDHSAKNNKMNSKQKSSNAPWLIDESTQTWIETLVHEILIPSNLSNDFQFHSVRMFKQTGDLRSTGYMQVITVLMKLILTIVSQNQKSEFSMPKHYKLFYLMLSEDINIVMSPVFHTEEEVNDIIKKLLELCCLSEGLFPPSENRLVQHQLYCLSFYIKICGSIKNFWAASGERTLKSIKDCVVKGGTSFDLSAIKKFSRKENSILSHEYSSEGNFFNNSNKFFSYQNKILKVDYFYTEVFDLNKLEECIVFNDSMESFIYVLILHIKKNTNDFNDAMKKSILYRFFFHYVNNYFSKGDSIPQCIESIAKDKNHIFYHFANALYKYLNVNQIKRYDNAMIYGTEFPSTKLLIKKIPFKNRIENDYTNDYLNDEWNSKFSYSSWFKCKDFYNISKIRSIDKTTFGIQSWYKNIHNHNEQDYHMSKKFVYGQFHYFLKIDESFPDESLHSCCLGCATLRDMKVPNDTDIFTELIEINNQTIKNSSHLNTFKYRDFYFVDLNDVVPTRIMIIGVDESFKAIRNKSNPYEDMKKYYSKSNILNRIIFVEMDEQRKGVMQSAKLDM